jgi:hypothetical protein
MLLSVLEFAQGEPTLVEKYLTPRGYKYSKNSLDVNKTGSSTERKNFGIPKELKVLWLQLRLELSFLLINVIECNL